MRALFGLSAILLSLSATTQAFILGEWLFKIVTPDGEQYERFDYLPKTCESIPNGPMRADFIEFVASGFTKGFVAYEDSHCEQKIIWPRIYYQEEVRSHEIWRLGELGEGLPVGSFSIYSPVDTVDWGQCKRGTCTVGNANPWDVKDMKPGWDDTVD